MTHVLDRLGSAAAAEYTSAREAAPRVSADHPLAAYMGVTAGDARNKIDPKSMYVHYGVFHVLRTAEKKRLMEIQTRCLRGDGAYLDREEWKTDAEGSPYVMLSWLDVNPPAEDEP